MVRTPGLSPYHARFLVPLDFSKYDLRDYLYHAYNVKCFNIRSYVKQMPVRDSQAKQRSWFRADSEKYMTVEMEQPFVWPALPEDVKPWGIGEFAKKVKENADRSGQIETVDLKREKAKSLREQVKALLMKKDTSKSKSGAQESEKLSTLELWEKKRTHKVVLDDEASRYVIKV
jgi:large subunit ribosomal protein L23